jgi:hypothetical protein
MTRLKSGRIAAVAAVVLLLSGAAYADNTVCTGAVVLVPDGSAQTGSFTAAQPRWFRFSVRADRSYVITSVQNVPSDAGTFVAIGALATDCIGTAFATAVTNNFGADPAVGSGPAGGDRVSFISTSTIDLFFPVTSGFIGAFTVTVIDTTQINTFFSTFSGFNTFYRFTNNTVISLNVRLKIVNDAGVVVKDTTFTIPGNRSAPTRNTTAADLNIPANTAGFAVIMHNGPANAVAVDAFLSGGGLVLPLKVVDARQKR